MNRRDHDIMYWDAILQPDGSYMDGGGRVGWYNAAGERHKEDGPAVIYANGRSYWYLNSKEYYSFDEWLRALNISDEAKMMLRLQYG
jgi:hypothetical protein